MGPAALCSFFLGGGEHVHTHEQGRDRERERERADPKQALYTVRAESNVGLELTNRKLTTRAQATCSWF